MTIADVLALRPGPALDEAVQLTVFGSKDSAPDFSTNAAWAITLIEKCRLFVARVHPVTDAERPYSAGQLAHDPELGRDVTVLRVTAPTMAIALCKAALLVTVKAQEAKRLAVQSSNAVTASAERAAARAKAKREAARPKVAAGGHKGLKARRKAEAVEAKKAAQTKAPVPAAQPPAKQGFSQPRAYLRVPVEKIPKRRDIVMPEAATGNR